MPSPPLSAETVLALMRNPDYCLYGWAKSKRERCAEDAETAFNNLSLQVGKRGGSCRVCALGSSYCRGGSAQSPCLCPVSATGADQV